MDGENGDMLVKDSSNPYDTRWRKLIHYGTVNPSDELGEDGDMYIQLAESPVDFTGTINISPNMGLRDRGGRSMKKTRVQLIT